eukprot:804903-Prymnesium_polylepis.1
MEDHNTPDVVGPGSYLSVQRDTPIHGCALARACSKGKPPARRDHAPYARTSHAPPSPSAVSLRS